MHDQLNDLAPGTGDLQLERRVKELERQLDLQTARLESALSALAGSDPSPDAARPTTTQPNADGTTVSTGSTRRDLLRNGAIAIGAGVAGAAALGTPAAAADNDPILIGAVTTGTSRTDVRISGAAALGTNVFTAQDSTYGNAAAPAAVGGYATGLRVGNGVYAYTEGIVASDARSGYALVALASSRGAATRAQIYIEPEGLAPTSDALSHRVGEIVVDSSGRLWFCTAAGTPGTWQEITGDRALITAAQAAADAAAGQADGIAADVSALQSRVDAIASGPTFLPTSQRAFDSRPGEQGDGGTKGALAAGESRLIDLTVDTDVPAGASAAIIHLTLAGSLSGGGFLSVYSGAVADLKPPGFSSLNWATNGQFEANTTVTKLSPTGTIKVFALNPAHVAVDVIGFYV